MLRNCVPSISTDDLQAVVSKCHYGDYFLLMQMAKNIDPEVFHEVVLSIRCAKTLCFISRG